MRTLKRTTRPWPIPQKRVCTCWGGSHTGHNRLSILTKNDSPLGRLNLMMARGYHFAWRRHENMSPCTDSEVNSKNGRVASWDGYQFRTGLPRTWQTPRTPTAVADVLTIRPWPIRHKRIGTSWVVSPIGNKGESIMVRNDSQPGFLHLALMYRYYILYRGDIRMRSHVRVREHMPSKTSDEIIHFQMSTVAY